MSPSHCGNICDWFENNIYFKQILLPLNFPLSYTIVFISILMQYSLQQKVVLKFFVLFTLEHKLICTLHNLDKQKYNIQLILCTDSKDMIKSCNT